MTDEQNLFTLRCAAYEWLRQNPNNPNARTVKEALRDTDRQDAVASDTRIVEFTLTEVGE